MNEEVLTEEENEAAARLRAVWFPNKVVLKATSHWMAESRQSQKIEEGLRALRWCKWQWVKNLYNPSEQNLFASQFHHCYHALKLQSLPTVQLPPNTNGILGDDLPWLHEDVDAMQQYLTGTLAEPSQAEKDSATAGHYGERHLWGHFSESDAGLQVHFWPVADCFPNAPQR